MKKDRIFKKIKQKILSGYYSEGDKLPTEFECAKLYDVSRDTVRNAFKMLEDEGFIKRVKSKGTFIKLPKVDPTQKTVYFLVPCYEYLQYSSEQFLQTMFDLIAECALANWHLTPVIFSKTNSNTDIWWENLSRFNSDSKIVVSHFWFSPYFKTLSNIGAKVAFITNDAPEDEKWHEYTSNWGHFNILDNETGKKAVKVLKEKKCKKIALIMNHLKSENNIVKKSFIKEAKKNDMKYCMLEPTDDNFMQFKEFYEKEKFDGLLFHLDEHQLMRKDTLRNALSIPKDIPVLSIPLKNSHFFTDTNEDIGIVKFPIRQMAHDIVKYLISPQKQKKKYQYTPQITYKDE